MAQIKILYCSAWGYKSRAASLAAKLERELQVSVAITPGKTGQFDVFVGDDIAIGKHATGILRRLFGSSGFPDESEAVAAVRAKL